MITIKYPLKPGVPRQGSVGKALDVNDHLFGPIVTEVHWVSGGVVIVEIEFDNVSRMNVYSLNPDDVEFGSLISDLPEGLITYEMYEEMYTAWIDGFGDLGEFATQDEITDKWFWDGRYVGLNPEFLADPVLAEEERQINENAVRIGTNMWGYEPNIHLVGAQVAYDTQTFKRPLIGDYTTHRHPNGTTTTYPRGYTPLGQFYISYINPQGEEFHGYVVRLSDPGGANMVSSESSVAWYWYRITTLPGQVAHRIRRSFLVNFDKVKGAAAIYADFASSLGADWKITIRGFPSHTYFQASEGHVDPIPLELEPIYTYTTTVSPAVYGLLKIFGPTRILTE